MVKITLEKNSKNFPISLWKNDQISPPKKKHVDGCYIELTSVVSKNTMKKCFFLSTKHSSILHGALVGAGTFQPFMEHETNSPELAMLIVKKVFAAAKLQLSQVGVLLGTHLTSHTCKWHITRWFFVCVGSTTTTHVQIFVCLKHILLCPMDDDFVPPPSDMFVN